MHACHFLAHGHFLFLLSSDRIRGQTTLEKVINAEDKTISHLTIVDGSIRKLPPNSGVTDISEAQ